MLVIASIGLVVNLVSMRLLSGGKDRSLNIKGAYLEVWSDLLGSIGVIAGALALGRFRHCRRHRPVGAAAHLGTVEGAGYPEFTVLPRLRATLAEWFGVRHTTIQCEHEPGIDAEEGHRFA